MEKQGEVKREENYYEERVTEGKEKEEVSRGSEINF